MSSTEARKSASDRPNQTKSTAGKRRSAVQVVSESIGEIREAVNLTMAMQESLESNGRENQQYFCERLEALESRQAEIFQKLESLVQSTLGEERKTWLESEAHQQQLQQGYEARLAALQTALARVAPAAGGRKIHCGPAA